MQIKNRHKKNINLFIRYLLGPLLFGWLCWSIFKQVSAQKDLHTAWQRLWNDFSTGRVLAFCGVVLLMLVNWSLEAWKWKLLVQRIQQVSFYTSFKAILSGLAFSVTTPNRVGEYLGRVLYMNEGNRLKAISMTITGSLSQLIVTVAMGLGGFLFLTGRLQEADIIGINWARSLTAGSVLLLVILTLFYFRIPWLARAIHRLPANRSFSWLISAMEGYDATLLLQVLSLSATRFLVFVIQYFVLFRLFNVELDWGQVWATVSVSFLIMAAIPTIALFTDLGLRGEIMLQLVTLFSANTLGISLAAMAIWLVNLIIPALAGSLLILGIRGFFKNKRGGQSEEQRQEKENT